MQVQPVPPLRERAEDIPLLVAHFTERIGKGTIFTVEALERLSRHSWPGNVRELESMVQKLVAYAGKYISAEDVAYDYWSQPNSLKNKRVVAPLLFKKMPPIQERRQELAINLWGEFWFCFGHKSDFLAGKSIVNLVRSQKTPDTL